MITALGVEFSQIINTMKTKIFVYVFLILAVLLLSNCEKNNESSGEQRTLLIASVKPVVNDATCLIGGANDKIPPIYIFKENDSNWRLWYSLQPIVGFDESYEEGYEYVIVVNQYRLDKPPADASIYVYRLEKIISKIQKESEDIPDYMIK
jgi:hypothetical protein